MKTLVLLAVIVACVADKDESASSYTSYAENFDLQPEREITFTQAKPRAAGRPSFQSAASTFSPQEEFFTVPVLKASSSPRSFFSIPRQSFSSSNSLIRSQPQASYSAPEPVYAAPQNTFYNKPVVPILRDDRRHPDGGAYSFALETGDGIRRQEIGSPVYSEEGPSTAIKGSYSFPLPDGQVFELHYIADENGFQPVSSFIPVAPAFPHPIPAHALEQIERGRREHEARARGDLLRRSYSAPSGSQKFSSSYSAPF